MVSVPEIRRFPRRCWTEDQNVEEIEREGFLRWQFHAAGRIVVHSQLRPKTFRMKFGSTAQVLVFGSKTGRASAESM
jgi:hypothetical protein